MRIIALICSFAFVFFSAMPMEAGIWIRPLQIKQGEIIVVSGLHHTFQNNYAFLGDCSLEFERKKYKFYKEVLSADEYKKSNGERGFHYITRLPTTPLTVPGDKNIILECPMGTEVFRVSVVSADFPIQHIQLTASKNSLTRTERETQLINQALATRSEDRLWDSSQPWVLPSNARRSSEYGLRRTYNGKLAENYFHKGLDFAGMQGAPITAPAKGKVLLLGKESDGFAIHGNCLFIDHGQGVISAYLHMSAFNVSEGQEVEAGQLLGKVGDTGIATGPHLHFGLYINEENINPEHWFQYAIP